MNLKINHFIQPLVCLSIFAAMPVLALDGWHLVSSTNIESKTSTWDYIAFEGVTKKLYLGHRKEGLQVFDPATQKLVGVIGDTAAHSANGATFAPEFDLGISNNEDGTYTPFKLSTLEAKPAVKIAEGVDTSHYDSASKRFVFNTEPDKEGADLVVLDAATLTQVGKIRVPTRKAEGADADGMGKFYLAGQDRDEIYVLDTKALKVTATWVKVLAMDHTANRLYSITANGTSDAGKKINTAVSPCYINTVFPNTFRVLTYGK